MKFYSFYFKGHYLVGNGVTHGESIEEAYTLAVDQLKEEALWEYNEDSFTIENLTEIDPTNKAVILFTGDY